MNEIVIDISSDDEHEVYAKRRVISLKSDVDSVTPRDVPTLALTIPKEPRPNYIKKLQNAFLYHHATFYCLYICGILIQFSYNWSFFRYDDDYERMR